MADPQRQLSEVEREQMRQWLRNWEVTGLLLEAERASRLAALTDTEAASLALDLWRFARPLSGDDAEGLRTIHMLVRPARGI